jgi:hypothetical protein
VPPSPSASAAQRAQLFAGVDADKNGSVSFAELGVFAVTQADFDKFDADHNGSLSQSEYAKWNATRRKDN